MTAQFWRRRQMESGPEPPPDCGSIIHVPPQFDWEKFSDRERDIFRLRRGIRFAHGWAGIRIGGRAPSKVESLTRGGGGATLTVIWPKTLSKSSASLPTQEP